MHSSPARRAARSLRQLAFAKGWSILCLCAPAAVLAQGLSTGPAVFFNDQRVGTAGTSGVDATGNKGCSTGPVAGTAGTAAPNVGDTVGISLVPLNYVGTLVAVGSLGGAGGRGANGDPNGHCGAGDFNARPGGGGGNVSLTVVPSANGPAAVYRLTSTGIVAVSHGGAGGTGGNNTRSGYRAGDGGVGGDGGNVILTNGVAMQVSGGVNSVGIAAQSGGGLGGLGGSAVGGSTAGNGAGGGNGGYVGVSNTAFIGTDGGDAISAQSIGGFGGDGGVNRKAHSGSGGAGGNGGAVSVDNAGTLVVGLAGRPNCTDTVTTGCNSTGSFGISAHSVGGGGGHAGPSAGLHVLGAEGGSAGHASQVSVRNTGAVSIASGASAGVFAQAIGGGGGSGGMAVATGRHAAGVGGAGGDGGDGARVTLVNLGDICTGVACATDRPLAVDDSTAGGAFGLLAQSIGGGGGAGGYARAKARAPIFGRASATAIGGSGGLGGSGDTVAVVNAGAIRTAEISSPGILAQSIGGGGGSGGGAIAYAAATLGDASSVSHGGVGGSGGHGGLVTVNCASLIRSDVAGLRVCGGVDAARAGAEIATAGTASAGIVAQSIGGGGGHGGYAMSLAGSVFASQAFGFGGSGGAGGTGGNVYAGTNGVNISTQGLHAPGLLAQSIGGGGGAGGSTIDVSLAYSGAAVSVGVGGTGGHGVSAGGVVATNTSASIHTRAEGSQGVVAQSIGGGGGNGGSAVTLAAAGYFSGALSVGGSGGTGGAGSAVNLLSGASPTGGLVAGSSIRTEGFGAGALLAQSIGGGGGNGGYSVAASGASFAAGAAAIGGNGGAGNNAGAVAVENYSLLTTTGGGAAALGAQSIAGGGGTGGYAIAGSLAQTVALSVGIGGSGGQGGIAEAVTVKNAGAISVSATGSGHAPGILAQSIGGSGGKGGFAVAGSAALTASAGLAVGGGGGNGGAAGAVTVENAADVHVTGAFSQGVLAQSMGGGGGSGGYTIAGALAGGASLAAAIGGGGGNGGTASDVVVKMTAADKSVTTLGAHSAGLVAQSLGGSGGTGGWALSASASLLASPAVSLGGSGGRGGRAGQAVVSTSQAVATDGQMSPGVLAQSIGGSGGNGGFAAAGSLSTVVALSAAIGGAGGAGSTANAVRVDTLNRVQTAGHQSAGIVAQSIGGNGGNGGAAVTASVATGNPKSSLSIGGAGSAGGAGGTGQAAGAVVVDALGGVRTSGMLSSGVVAQSLGGGGGNGGNSAAFTFSASGGNPNGNSLSASVAIGGKGAAGGTGGTVNVNVAGKVETGYGHTPGSTASLAAGDLSVGVLAQSVGGSGGNGGSAYANAISGTGSLSVAIGGGGGVGSAAGAVNVCSNSNLDGCSTATGDGGISTTGNHSAGIVAQSIGGGGGHGGASTADATSNKYSAAVAVGGFGGGGGDASSTSVRLGGTVSTLGAQSSGVIAQSIGGGGGHGGSATASATGQAGAVANLFKNAGVAAYTGLVGRTVGNATVAVAEKFNSEGAPEDNAQKDDNGVGASLSIGGSGGMGGVGRAVLVNTNAVITTQGALSTGVVAQSVGGGGGHGGNSSANAAGGNAAVAVSLGGSGGVGGDAGVVTVYQSGRVSTAGAQAIGVFAQSVGGGGGSGGSASSSAETGGKVAASFGLGGSGGGGGQGGTVNLVNGGVVNTAGSHAIGLFAQSVGGGGGNGGSASSSSVVSPAEASDTSTSASTSTSGVSSAPNNTGSSASAGVASNASGAPQGKGAAAGGDSGYAAGLAIGGAGGRGSTGGDVAVYNTGAVSTGLLGGEAQVSNASGIFAQSVGGGGGNGGSSSSNTEASKASVALSLGGLGGGAGSAGNVGVFSPAGALTTHAVLSSAIVAQSVGGGGGNGGSSSSTAGKGSAASVALGLGGLGGAGGNGGAVVVCGEHSGFNCQSVLGSLVTTTGAMSHGIVAQSVGGGGGNGGSVTSAATAGDASANSDNNASTGEGGSSSSAASGVAVAAGLGGTGGSGGSGSMVSVITGNSIKTSGAQSAAIVAQSVGGGGGAGGSVNSNANSGAYALSLSLGASGGQGGKGATVGVETGRSTSLSTEGALAYGILAQSIGGGGGAGGSSSSTSADGGKANIGMSLGGRAGSGQDSGVVRVVSGADISTLGAGATGVLAQSVGGGGGTGGSSNASSSGGKLTASLGLGGAGGAGGSAGELVVTVNGGISTAGTQASAVLAQSIGGGGGNSGSVSSSTQGSEGVSASIALGAHSGSQGGSANHSNVVVQSSGSLVTRGAFAPAVVSQSIGGGGGNGAAVFSSAAGAARSMNATLALGAQGGSGGNGQVAEANVYQGGVSTYGVGSLGIVAQSIGGGGGSGGVASLAASGDWTSTTAGLSLGGNGGAGGNASYTGVFSSVDVHTRGLYATAILSQSIGGGGGLAAVATRAGSDGGWLNGAITLGGTNGAQGSALDTNATVGGNVTTEGWFAYGTVVQSIAGGGGLAQGAGYAATLGNSSGSNSGTSGWARARQVGNTLTSGGGSIGLVVQSIAGGGGLASTYGTAQLGGGSFGANAGAVSLCNIQLPGCTEPMSGSITTNGTAAAGVVAQSIGGGGGTVISPEYNIATKLVHGTGLAGSVSVVSSTAVTTGGPGAPAMVLQSIGGGGGYTSGVFWQPGSATVGVQNSSAASGSHGNAMSVDLRGAALNTAGANGSGLVAQSIGGGGGLFTSSNVATGSSTSLQVGLGSLAGATNGGQASVQLENASISTTGAASFGALVQSIGAGGGMFAWSQPTNGAASAGSTNVRMGQGDAASGVGGAVAVSSLANVRTDGAQAAGIVAQSISNGGGVLVASTSGTLSGATLLAGNDTSAGARAASIGGVTLDLPGGAVQTRGEMSPAVVAQAIGGGGGMALVRGTGSIGRGEPGTQLGGNIASSAVLGTSLSTTVVSVHNKASISTIGDGSIGIVAQAIGGGGGLVYASGSALIGGMAGGNAGSVLVVSDAPIRTSGVNAFGILAQSVGGGGGAVLSTGNAVASSWRGSGGNAGDVTVVVNKDIVTTGAGAHGVVAQSVRGGGGLVTNGTTTTMQGGTQGTSGLVKITVAPGVTVSATGAGARGIWGWSSTDPVVEVSEGARILAGVGGTALHFDGPINALNNRGFIASTDGGLAVHTTGGDIAVTNQGAIHGNIKLTTGATNSVHNQAGGTLVSHGSIDLGGSGTLRNDGVMRHGGATGTATQVNGALHQGETGVIELRMNHSTGKMDAVQVSGSARLAGTLRPVIQDPHLVTPGTVSMGGILSADRGVNTEGLKLKDTAVLDFELHHQDGTVAFTSTADFSPNGMNEDAERLGDIIGTAQDDDMPNFRALTAKLVHMETAREVHQAYWELSGAGATSVTTVGTRLSTVFSRMLVDRVGAAPAKLPAGQAGHRAWLQALGETHNARNPGVAASADVKASTWGLAAGTDTRVNANTTVGLALASTRMTLGMSQGYRATGRGTQLGAYGAREMGSWYVAGAINHARHELDTERTLELMNAQYSARLQAYSVGLRLESGLRTTKSKWNITPFGALQVQQFVMRAHSEHASLQPHMALNYKRGEYVQARTELGAAIEGSVPAEAGATLHLRGRVAWAHEAWSEHRMHASFQTLHAKPFSMVGVTPVPDLAVIAAMAELRASARLSIELNLQGEFGKRTQTRSAGVALRYSW